jgi:hypothetical protein
MKKRIFYFGFAAVVALAVVLYFYGPSTTPSGQKPLTTLSSANFAEFETAFDEAAGGPRLLVLVSPT